MFRLAWVLVCVLTGTLLSAQVPPGGGGSGPVTTTVSVATNNVQVNASVFGPGPNANVSGTNVSFSAQFFATMSPPEGEPGPGDWENARLDAFVVKLGGETVRHWNGEMPPPPYPPPAGVAVRFQSTHFDEGGIELKGIGYFSVKPYGSNNWIPLSPLEVVVPVNVYNKGLTMGTKVQLPVGGGPPIVEDPPGPMTLGSKAVVDQGKAALIASKHTLLGTPGDPYYHRTDLINHLKVATAFIASTHGSLGSYSSSYGPAQENEEVGFGAGFSGRAATTPPFNLVVFYSCGTLGADGSPGGNQGFQISSSSIDKAYLGFGGDISLIVRKYIGKNTNGEDQYQYGFIYQHAEVLFSALAAGKTILDAVDLANDSWMPGKKVGEEFVEMPMYMQGDSRTTINNVYLYFGEIIEEGGPTWYWAPLPGLP